MSVLIKGGRIVTAADDYVGDIFIEDERVTLIGESLDVQADKVIDASGKYVMPGAIDPHTHMEMPFGGTVSCDDFTSGTISAAFGGTTSHVDFCLQEPGQSLPDALATWHEKIERAKPVIDVGFHLAVTDLQEGGTLEDLAKASELPLSDLQSLNPELLTVVTPHQPEGYDLRIPDGAMEICMLAAVAVPTTRPPARSGRRACTRPPPTRPTAPARTC